MTALEMAIDEYVAQDWPVIPLHTVEDGACTCLKPACTSPGKHPRTKNGLKDASADRTKILSWLKRWPNANFGIVTGGRWFVVDIDGPGAMRTWEAYQAKRGAPPPTYRCNTGRVDADGNRTGWHLYYRLRVGQIAPPNSQGVIGPGIDVRGEGGYVVAPPSLHASGERYRWDEDSAYELAGVSFLGLWGSIAKGRGHGPSCLSAYFYCCGCETREG
jgi:hypothetical protein